MNEKYDHKKIEGKWQKKWEEDKIYKTSEELKGPKSYVLDMFPYPSGDGLHVGHPKGYIATDIYSRMKKMQGHNILHSMGWDAFGLPAENYAIKNKVHPKIAVEKNIKKFKEQLKKIGFNYDWEREVNTTDPEFYKWTEWIFLKMLEKGLAYESYEPINWCPSCQTGLANEDLEGGVCERCGSVVEKKPMRQWVLKITDYAERMLIDLDKLEWPEYIKESQRNWIGKSEGTEIEFKINPSPTLPEGKGVEKGAFEYHTTDPDTWKALQDKVLEMRKSPTKAEDTIWQSLRAHKIGLHFRRQHIIGNFIVDFVCLEKKLVIEVDGDIHDHQKKEDEERTKFLNEKGFKVIRFRNEEILNDLEKTIDKISDALKALPFGEGMGGVKVFTTRADTLFGATYLVLAPENQWLEQEIQNPKSEITNKSEIQDYINSTKQKTEIERGDLKKEKTGVEIKGVKAINPATGEEIPIWIADYVLGNYGTGAVMAVPAHDERDFEFAKKYNLISKEVVLPNIIDKRNPPIEGKKIVPRNNVHPIVLNPKTGKYLALKWREFDWTTFPMGGIEEGEDVVEAARREVKAETGFVNLKLIKVLNGQVRAEYFAAHKDVNRVSFTTAMVFELIDETKSELELEAHEKFETVWLDESQLNYDVMTHAEIENWKEKMDPKYITHTDEGVLINSKEFNELSSEEAREKITEKFGKKVTKYKLRDWVFSRQRYWGEPIPVIHCEKCGVVSVPEDQLPVKLPEVEHYEPTGTGESPLAEIKDWVNTTCPKCGGSAKRETNTMPQWAGSSWYYLRFIDPKNSETLIDKEKEKYWSPVDMYVGGAEHATRHLIYARFWHKFLFDIGVVNYDEPFKKLQNVGLILAEDGRKMSKRFGNVINPDDIVKTWGADSLRLYEMFMGPFNDAIAWNTDNMIGVRRFLERVWKISLELKAKGLEEKPKNQKLQTLSSKLEASLHKTIKKVTGDIENFKFNTAISTMMIFINELEHNIQEKEVSKVPFDMFEEFLKLLAPFAPHITEEMWNNLGHKNSIHLEEWPKWDESKIKEERVVIVVQINGKVRAQFETETNISETEAKEKACALPEVQKWLLDKEIKKVIFVPNKLVNFVV